MLAAGAFFRVGAWLRGSAVEGLVGLVGMFPGEGEEPVETETLHGRVCTVCKHTEG